jgi:hypothetical protein
MATTPTAGSGDPSVLRQVERQNAALTTRPQVSAAPSVVGTSGTSTSTTSNNRRSLAPVVSGSEVLYPQSTTSTSRDAVTINSSVNNDSGDVTTVYSTNGQITVNPINQTINQYTSTDSGVSQIVAGNGVTITSTGGSGTGIVTINSVTTTLGNIVTINLDGNSANVLHGDGTWSADQTTYGNSNVAAYLPTYTGNIGGNVVTANLFAGNGSSLSAIAGANVSGFVPNANVANTAFAVAGANVSGFVPNANVANTAFAVAAANVSGLGNIATINLTGSTSNVLYGNGVFAAVAGGANTGNVTFDDNIVIGTGDEYGGDGLFLATGPDGAANLQYLRLRGGDFPTHIHLDTGNNAFYDQYFGNDNKFVKLEAGDTGNVVVGTDDATGNLYNWTFTSDGNLILADGNSVIQSIANSSLDPLNPNVSTMVLTPDPGYSTQSLVLDPTAPGHIHLRAPGANIDEPSANIFLGGEDSSFEVGYHNGSAPNVFVHSGGNTWTFDNTGNLNLPNNGNINANGGGITQVINEDLNIVVQDEEDDGWSLLNTITDSLGNNISQTTLDSSSFTIDLDMLGGDYRWQFDGNTLQVSDDSQIRSFGSNVVLQAMSSGSNTVASLQSVSNTNDPNIFTTIDATTTGANISVYDGGSNSGTGYTWQFANDGRLTFPGTPRIDTDADNFEVQAAENINFEANAVVNIYTDSGNNAYQWQFGDDGTLTVPFEGVIRSFDDTIVLQSVDTGTGNANSVRLATDGSLYFEGTEYLNGWFQIANDSGDANIVSPSGNISITPAFGVANAAGKSLTLQGGDADQSDFYTGTGGAVNITGGLGSSDDGGGGGPGGNVNITSGNSADPAGHAGNINITAGSNDWVFDYNGDLTLPGNLVYIGASPAPSIRGFSSVSAVQFTNGNSNVTINANSSTWTFGTNDNLYLPDTTSVIANASITLEANSTGNITGLSVNGDADANLYAHGNVKIVSDSSNTTATWSFGSNGNLTLPANTFAINYANGTQVSLGGGSSIANGNSNVSIATANGNVTISAVGNTTMTVTGTGANVTGTLTSTGKIGYASGSTVTQITSRGTGVTINALAGTIVTTSIAMVANEIDTFSVINSSVDPNNDIVLAQIVSPNQGTYNCIANPAVIGGFSNGFYINIVNISGFTTADETITVRFMVIKAPNA